MMRLTNRERALSCVLALSIFAGILTGVNFKATDITVDSYNVQHELTEISINSSVTDIKKPSEDVIANDVLCGYIELDNDVTPFVDESTLNLYTDDLDNEAAVRSYAKYDNTKLSFSVISYKGPGEEYELITDETDFIVEAGLTNVYFLFDVCVGDTDVPGVKAYQVFYEAETNLDSWETVDLLRDMNVVVSTQPSFLMSVCDLEEPEITEEPTPEPTVEPTVEPTSEPTPIPTPDDSYVYPTEEELNNEDWIFDNIGVFPVWDKIVPNHRPGEGVVVAVVDTCPDINEPEIRNNLWVNVNEIPDNGIDDDKNGYIDDVYGADFKGNMYQYYPYTLGGHGTYVATIIAAEAGNGKGVGVAYGAKIMVCGCESKNSPGYLDDNACAKAIKYAASNGADVINMSFSTDAPSTALRAAVEFASEYCVLVAASGNDNIGTHQAKGKNYPAAFDCVIGVMATDNPDGRVSDWCNWDHETGDHRFYNICAPGDKVYGFCSMDEETGERVYEYNGGTSASAPIVSGLAAIICGEYSRELYPRSIIQGMILRDTGNILYYEKNGETFNIQKAYLPDMLACNWSGEDSEINYHNIESTLRVEPTCTEVGHTASGYCTDCGYVFCESEEIPALGHDRYTTIYIKDPTCTEPGNTAEFTCRRCNEVVQESQVVEPLGHDLIIIEGEESTCYNNGYTDYIYCKRCKVIIQLSEEIPHLEHIIIEDEPIEPTCTEPGFKGGIRCILCGTVADDGDVVPALGHKPVLINSVEATVYEDGHTDEIVCERCDEVLLESQIIPKVEVDENVLSFSERLYSCALNREPDSKGVTNWSVLLMDSNNPESNVTGASVAFGFFFSDEFINSNVSDEEFINRLYSTFMDRSADPNGFTTWINYINDGHDRNEVFMGFVNSQEWADICFKYGIASGGLATPNIPVVPGENVVSFATRLYTKCLGRDPEKKGLSDWAQYLAEQKVTGTQAAHGFFFSDEFISLNLNDSEYIDRLYRTFMDREADNEGKAIWLSLLESGEYDREKVFYGFAKSSEFANICEEYGIKQ